MNMIEVTPTGNPLPGNWQKTYTAEWREAFPQGDLTPGHYLGQTWHTETPWWDKWWFLAKGAQMPTPTVTIPTRWITP